MHGESAERFVHGSISSAVDHGVRVQTERPRRHRTDQTDHSHVVRGGGLRPVDVARGSIVLEIDAEGAGTECEDGVLSICG